MYSYREYIKTVKNGRFCEELPRENNFEVVLADFRCYEYNADNSGAVQKVSTTRYF